MASVETARPEKSWARAPHHSVGAQVVTIRLLKKEKILGGQRIRGGVKVSMRRSGETAKKSKWGRAQQGKPHTIWASGEVQAEIGIIMVRSSQCMLEMCGWNEGEFHSKVRSAWLTQDDVEDELTLTLALNMARPCCAVPMSLEASRTS